MWLLQAPGIFVHLFLSSTSSSSVFLWGNGRSCGSRKLHVSALPVLTNVRKVCSIPKYVGKICGNEYNVERCTSNLARVNICAKA